MLPTSALVDPATSWSLVGRRIQLSHQGQQYNDLDPIYTENSLNYPVQPCNNNNNKKSDLPYLIFILGRNLKHTHFFLVCHKYIWEPTTSYLHVRKSQVNYKMTALNKKVSSNIPYSI